MPETLESPRIRFVQDGKGSITFIKGEGDNEEIATHQIDPAQRARLDNMVDGVEADAEKSEARKRLEKLRAQRGNLVESVEIDNELWAVRSLNFPQIVEAQLLAGRIKRAPNNEGAVWSNSVAILHSCVVVSESDDTPYFGVSFDAQDNVSGDAVDYVGEPSVSGLVNQLFNECARINPDLLPREKKATSSSPQSNGKTNGAQNGNDSQSNGSPPESPTS